MFDPRRHPAFSPVTDPLSGTISWHLDARVAPVQRQFYYTNPSLSADGRWLWLAVAFPPNPQLYLARIGLAPDMDAAATTLRWFPQSGFAGNSPGLCPEGDAVWFCSRDSVYRIGADGHVDQVGSLPASLVAGRQVFQLATHLTLSADRRHLLLDSVIGNASAVSLLDVASGRVEVLAEFQDKHNHGQFSLHDPDLFLIAHDQHQDPISGRFIHHRQRTHVMRRDGGGYRCINPQFQCRPFNGACHEWWLADGRIAYVEYDSGVWVHDLGDGSDIHVWREPLCHAHADPSGRFWCADQSPYFWKDTPCQVLFYDSGRQRRHVIHGGLPLPPVERSPWHLDPHPQFSPCGSLVVWMSTARGQVDLAITPIDQFTALP